MSNLIQLSNINKSFLSLKKINVLKKISYKFKSGKIYSLMGPSGSGKSTLLNLLSLIDRPSSGSIIIDNKKIDPNNSQKNDLLRANKIGIIYQQDNLLSDFTAIENLTLASLASGKNQEYALNISQIMLKKVGSWIGSAKKYVNNIQNEVSNIDLEDNKIEKKEEKKDES